MLRLLTRALCFSFFSEHKKFLASENLTSDETCQMMVDCIVGNDVSFLSGVPYCVKCGLNRGLLSRVYPNGNDDEYFCDKCMSNKVYRQAET